MVSEPEHTRWMALALEAASSAGRLGNVPVGAVIVRDGKPLACAANLREVLQDPTAHAEVLALRRASQVTGEWRLEGCTVYVTLEPCGMCAHAIAQTRVDRVVFALREPKMGAVVSRTTALVGTPIEVVDGPGREQALALMQAFFEGLRRARPARAGRAVDQAE